MGIKFYSETAVVLNWYGNDVFSKLLLFVFIAEEFMFDEYLKFTFDVEEEIFFLTQ